MTTRRRVEASNNFHGSHAAAWADRAGYLSPRQVRRMRRALCAGAGCICGNDLGECGKLTLDDQPAGYEMDYEGGAMLFTV